MESIWNPWTVPWNPYELVHGIHMDWWTYKKLNFNIYILYI